MDGCMRGRGAATCWRTEGGVPLPTASWAGGDVVDGRRQAAERPRAGDEGVLACCAGRPVLVSAG
jgi:hypothetical protein